MISVCAFHSLITMCWFVHCASILFIFVSRIRRWFVRRLDYFRSTERSHKIAKYDKAPFKIMWKSSATQHRALFVSVSRSVSRGKKNAERHRLAANKSSYDTVACSANRSARWMKNAVAQVEAHCFHFTSFLLTRNFWTGLSRIAILLHWNRNFAQKPRYRWILYMTVLSTWSTREREESKQNQMKLSESIENTFFFIQFARSRTCRQPIASTLGGKFDCATRGREKSLWKLLKTRRKEKRINSMESKWRRKKASLECVCCVVYSHRWERCSLFLIHRPTRFSAEKIISDLNWNGNLIESTIAGSNLWNGIDALACVPGARFLAVFSFALSPPSLALRSGLYHSDLLNIPSVVCVRFAWMVIPGKCCFDARELSDSEQKINIDIRTDKKKSNSSHQGALQAHSFFFSRLFASHS